MALVLNKLTEAQVEKNLLMKLDRLEKIMERLSDDKIDLERKARLTRALGRNSYDVGACLYYQQANAETIKHHLSVAGSALVKMHAERPLPEPNSARNPWFYQRSLNLAVCFCSGEVYKQAGQIDEHAFRNPKREDNRVIATYLIHLGDYLATGKLASESLNELKIDASSKGSSKDVKKWALPAINGLIALEHGNQAEVNDSIQQLVKSQQYEASSGEFKDLSLIHI